MPLTVAGTLASEHLLTSNFGRFSDILDDLRHPHTLESEKLKNLEDGIVDNAGLLSFPLSTWVSLAGG